VVATRRRGRQSAHDIATLEAHRRRATTESGSISYLDIGRGRPAVFIHGILTNSLLWRNVIPAVAANRRCIAVDLPGHGGTPPALDSADVSLTALARRVTELCDHLGLARFDLVANDTGGAVGQIVAAHLRDRLASVTFTSCDTEGNCPPKLFAPVALASRPAVLARIGPHIAARRALARSLLAAGYQHVGQLPDEVVDAYAKPVLGTPRAARAFGRLITAISSGDLAAVRPELAKLQAPTLIVWGTGDLFFTVRWAHRLANLIPGTTALHTLKGARMHFPDYRAAEFLPLLQQHWADHND
jgi:pimeloyl-ACP methyl ester carboxylesterase